jgi:hypothetical protein
MRTIIFGFVSTKIPALLVLPPPPKLAEVVDTGERTALDNSGPLPLDHTGARFGFSASPMAGSLGVVKTGALFGLSADSVFPASDLKVDNFLESRVRSSKSKKRKQETRPTISVKHTSYACGEQNPTRLPRG